MQGYLLWLIDLWVSQKHEGANIVSLMYHDNKLVRSATCKEQFCQTWDCWGEVYQANDHCEENVGDVDNHPV